MSAPVVNDVSLPLAVPAHLSRPAAGIIVALFCGYLAVGLPLPVLPLFIHDKLNFSNFIVGLVIGVQFVATVLTRGYAGRLTDHYGGKRSALQGAVVCALGGLLYLVAATPALSPAISLAVVIAGRLVAGWHLLWIRDTPARLASSRCAEADWGTTARSLGGRPGRRIRRNRRAGLDHPIDWRWDKTRRRCMSDRDGARLAPDAAARRRRHPTDPRIDIGEGV